MRKSYFITAIDTDAGKSIATGVMARYLMKRGTRVITQKIAQTGCTGISEDIETHRRIMDVPLFPEDREGVTCPYVFPFPAAPQLSAKLAGGKIDFAKIHEVTIRLEEKFDCVLVEGVGGLMVPMVENLTVLDYMKKLSQPAILVTNARLGSVNHTLLSLEALKNYGIELVGLVYNQFIETDSVITADSLDTLTYYLHRYYPEAVLITMGWWTENSDTPDFSLLFDK